MAQADRVHSTPPTSTPAIAVVTIPRFETLQDAEDTLTKQGFRLVPNTCIWIDADGGIDAGIYPVKVAHDVSKYRIEYRRQVLPVDLTRRGFLSQAAGTAAGGSDRSIDVYSRAGSEPAEARVVVGVAPQSPGASASGAADGEKAEIEGGDRMNRSPATMRLDFLR
jgi:hypothetical protein